MQKNIDSFSWKRGKDKSRKLKKISLASHPFFFCFSFFSSKDALKSELILGELSNPIQSN